ncbi:MAG: ABC transporter substrate-binding protein [Streptosporangiaceae bacterium]
MKSHITRSLSGLWRSGTLAPATRRRAVAAVACVTLCALEASACASSSNGGSSTTAAGAKSATIKLAYLGDQSGALATTFGPELSGVQAFVDYYNAHGGLYGHKLVLSVYDDQSSSSAVPSNARLAVQQGADVIISQDPYFDSAVPYLQSTGIPVFGAGITAGFYGKDKTTFFSPEGDWIDYTSDAGMKFFVQKGLKKLAVVSDANPGNVIAAHEVAKAVPLVGGTLVYSNYSVDDTNTASLLALAQRLKIAGAQAMLANLYGTAAPELQADLNQIGAHAVVLSDSTGFDPAVTKQFGTTIDGLLGEQNGATPLNSTVPPIKIYQAAMKQYEPSGDPYNASNLFGWYALTLFGGAVHLLGAKAPTYANIVAAGNSIKNFTADGMLQPVSFPEMHYTLAPCLSFAQVINGQFKIVSGSGANFLLCGTPVGDN